MCGPGLPDEALGLGQVTVEPGWILLSFQTFNAVHHQPTATNRALSRTSPRRVLLQTSLLTEFRYD